MKVAALIALGILSLLAAGCSTDGILPSGSDITTARVSTGKDEFTGVQFVSMGRGLVRSKDTMWSTPAFDMQLAWEADTPDIAALIPVVDGAIVEITDLEINIDGTITSLEPREGASKWKIPDSPYGIESSRHAFFIPIATLRQMVTAKKVLLKLTTSDGYAIGYFHVDEPSIDPTAKNGLIKALSAIDASLGPKS